MLKMSRGTEIRDHSGAFAINPSNKRSMRSRHVAGVHRVPRIPLELLPAPNSPTGLSGAEGDVGKTAPPLFHGSEQHYARQDLFKSFADERGERTNQSQQVA